MNRKWLHVAMVLVLSVSMWIMQPAKPAKADSAAFTTAGLSTWTAPAGVTFVIVEVWGGGGKGGTRTTDGSGGGGGGGAYSLDYDITVVPGTTYNVYVGAGSSTTAAGEDSYFIDASTVMAQGGNSVADNSATGASGGSAASGVGDLRNSGGSGANGVYSLPNWTFYGGGGGSSAGRAADGANATGPTGATAPVGGGNGGDGRSDPFTGDGSAGSTPGGGGGGGKRSLGLGTGYGGNGASGQVVIYFNLDPNSVELLSFRATGRGKAVRVAWETASNVDNLGFNLYRATSVDGPRTQVNEDLILSEVAPGSPSGAVFTYEDLPMMAGKTYFYWLEAVSMAGQTRLYGPLEVPAK